MRRVSLLALVIGVPLCLIAQDRFITSFPLEINELELSRAASPTAYFDKIGKRSGLMGCEGGGFEMWVWPWKVLRNFEVSFLLGTSTQPLQGRDVVRRISVTPEATVLTYAYESFTVREIIIVPRNEPGAIVLLDVFTTAPLTIIAGFAPVMQPMWPAGIGGQFSYWDDSDRAYVISEGQRRGAFLCGSPAAAPMAAPPAHMFADSPLQFKIEISPGETNGKFIPLVIAGSPVKAPMDSVRVAYRRLRENARTLYGENRHYYQRLFAHTLGVTTPDKDFNLAYEWGKVALDNLLVENPLLGEGMVAGFGLSGGGGRPGFAWFFGGDAYINSLALNGYGAHATVRTALTFTQKWQRQQSFPVRPKDPSALPRDVGKMAHELSQSDGLCDWWNDYHYGYNHADTTPWYVVAMADYVRTSGDVDFLRRSWQSVKQAYAWCAGKDSDGDGLMDLKGAGLGALEFGSLVGIYADVYTCGVWVQAIKDMAMMAAIMDDAEMRRQSEADLVRGVAAFEKKFWMDREGYYTYGATEKGEQVREKTPWSGVALMFGIAREDRASSTVHALSGSDLCTDWGVRSLARSSPLFEPTNYNYGAVWPFIGSFFNTVQFRYGSPVSAYTVLRSTLLHAFDDGLGLMPEVYSGELNLKLGEAYHHQGFSTTGYLLPLLRGLLGIEVDAVHKTITLSPRLPAHWRDVRLRNLRAGGTSCDLVITQTDTSISVSAHALTGVPCTLRFAPYIPLLARTTGDATTITGTLTAGKDLSIAFPPVPRIVPPHSLCRPGDIDRLLKIVSEKADPRIENRMILAVEGLAGESYRLQVHRPDLVASVSGARLDGDQLLIDFEAPRARTFIRKEIGISIRRQ